MVSTHHLQAKLKRLRLGGMLDTLQVRLDQTQQQQLGYLQFLELMLEDEITRREQKGLAYRIAQAGPVDNHTSMVGHRSFSTRTAVSPTTALIISTDGISRACKMRKGSWSGPNLGRHTR